ncbi:MAG: UDP-N-acetylmuramate dehydrogenase [Acidimicrobiales bacterium]
MSARAVRSWAGSGLAEVASALGGLCRRGVPLGPLTTYRVGGPAALFVEVGNEGELERLMEALAGHAVDLLVVGKGSNLLVADSGWPGVAIRLAGEFARIGSGGGLTAGPGAGGSPGPGRGITAGELTAGGGAAYPVLARRASSAGGGGMEWAVGIPGSVGGAVRMNAGGHGAQTSDRLVACRVVGLRSGTSSWRPAAALALGYRTSSIAASELVVEATFRLDAGDTAESNARIAEIVSWRRANQPGGQNAGSVFTNPDGDSAGRLIEAAGLKGLRVGSAAVSAKHANFVQADEGGSADDVAKVVATVREQVSRRLGVDLEVELQMLGFGASA